jgi:diketogulonate reductase-like aldo/keto reductase
MPVLGLGVWQVSDGPETERAVSWALEAGYRHIDTAQAYRNEASVGRALVASGIPREQLFVTTKFYPEPSSDPLDEAQRSLERLGLDRVDLYLVHWPEGGPTWAWPGMEMTLERDLTRSIGISNFGVDQLDQVLAVATHPPAVNQIQLSPFQYRRALLDACARRRIAPIAYSPLTHGEDLGDRTIAAVAARVGRTPAQVILRWGVERGFAVIPKSTDRGRILENARIFDFSLDTENLAALDGLDRTGGSGSAHEDPWWSEAPRGRGLKGRIARRLRR